ncbi:MAG: hypothetical protein Q8K00_06850 [Syntrophales bacterium]|nr:hypothetical protein [Syntrophales bacterium]
MDVYEVYPEGDSCFVLLFVILMGMIAFGDVQSPPVMHSINEVAAKVNRSDIPPISRFPARDGVHLAYRAYPAAAEKIAILLHGSSASGQAMHAMGKALNRRVNYRRPALTGKSGHTQQRRIRRDLL